jgi:hypothetical protein
VCPFSVLCVCAVCQVPMTMMRVAELMREAGVPQGVFQMVNGTREVVHTFFAVSFFFPDHNDSVEEEGLASEP